MGEGHRERMGHIREGGTLCKGGVHKGWGGVHKGWGGVLKGRGGVHKDGGWVHVTS